jgi:hypothetical protein
MRITLVHALKHSIAPIEASFARLWPDARLMNLLDDGLSADLARDGRLTDAMTGRFLSLGRYAASTGTDAILFTCSAFGPCIEAVAREQAPMPVLKPNEAMIEQAAVRGRRIGLLSTFEPTLASMAAAGGSVDLRDGLSRQFRVQCAHQKYFASPFGGNRSVDSAIPPRKRCVSRSSRTRGGTRWTRQRFARDV